MAGRNANGEGTIYRRKDGRYEAALYVTTASGIRKRIRLYGKTRADVHAKLVNSRAQEQRGVPVPDKTWQLGDFLDYWLENIIKPNRRPATYDRYEAAVRLYLKPGLGQRQIARLSVQAVQTFLNQQLAAGKSVRSVQILRETLRSALSRALREELVYRNVAQLVELPKWEQKDIRPWTMAEAKAFLAAAQADTLYPAFVLLVLYGLRRGEVLGLRWCDVDFAASVIRIRQQVQRVTTGLHIGPVKTAAGRRDLPMLGAVRRLLESLRDRQAADLDSTGTVLASRNGTPIEPRNLVRSFQQICNEHSIRLITIHQIRHTTATLLKDLHVPVRDVQLILGHSDISITQQIYQHDTPVSRRASLSQIEAALFGEESEQNKDGNARERCRQLVAHCRHTLNFKLDIEVVLSVIFGTPGWIRTNDTWFRSCTEPRFSNRLTVVSSAVESHRRQWLIGCAAVYHSRQVNSESTGVSPDIMDIDSP
jgi:integrase